MACNDICDQDCPHKVHRDDDESDCEHPAYMVGPWSSWDQEGTRPFYRIGWCCAACGLSMTTGTSEGRPCFGQVYTL